MDECDIVDAAEAQADQIRLETYQSGTWITKKGKHIPFSELPRGHLIHIIHMLERHGDGMGCLPALNTELHKRNAEWAKNKAKEDNETT